ncbi:MAG: DUF4123 domain-containing protein [Polyangiaceae bacterium]
MVPHAPHLLLETLAFRGDSQRFTLAAGGGRTALSDFVVLGDEQLSGAHFEITWDGQGASVRDLGSATGTLVEGRRAEVAEVRHGGWIRAGNTDFRAYVEGFSGGRARAGGVSGAGGAAGSGGAAGAGGAAGVLRRLLSREGERAFAVVDAARSPRALELLKESVDAHTSLFDGAPGEALSRVAPYLVELAPERSMLLERLAGEGWGAELGSLCFVECAPSRAAATAAPPPRGGSGRAADVLPLL